MNLAFVSPLPQEAITLLQSCIWTSGVTCPDVCWTCWLCELFSTLRNCLSSFGAHDSRRPWLCLVSACHNIITARKRSLGQGTVFTPVCLFMGGLYDVTSCLTAWSHVPRRGGGGGLSLSRGSLCLDDLSPGGDRDPPVQWRAGGAHPTGILSCYFRLLESNLDFKKYAIPCSTSSTQKRQM